MTPKTRCVLTGWIMMGTLLALGAPSQAQDLETCLWDPESSDACYALLSEGDNLIWRTGLQMTDAAQSAPKIALGGALEGDTSGLEDVLTASCAWNVSPEQVFALEILERDTVTLTVMGLDGFDPVVSVRLLDEEIGCNDDGGLVESPRASQLNVALEPGTYQVVVEGYGDAAGAFVLDAQGLPGLEMVIVTDTSLSEVVTGSTGFMVTGQEESLYIDFFPSVVAHPEIAYVVAERSNGSTLEASAWDGGIAIDLEGDYAGSIAVVGYGAEGIPVTKTITVTLAEAPVTPDPSEPFCPVWQRMGDQGCVACPSNGYQDPTNPHACLTCAGGTTFKWLLTRVDAQPSYHDTYIQGATPQCICPEGSYSAEDAHGNIVCQSHCPTDQLWVMDPVTSTMMCVASSYIDPNNPQQWVDTDNDGLSDWFETQHFNSNPNNIDADSDGLDDYLEWYYQTNPNLSDSDYDGLSDGDEAKPYTSNPAKFDTDGDGLSDKDELKHNTLPIDSDTDNDGLSDGDEVNNRTTSPLLEDSDRDGLTDCQEVQATCLGQTDAHFQASDPMLEDTDSDGLVDFYERHNSVSGALRPTDPYKADTDGDGLTDDIEFSMALNGIADADADSDGLKDAAEVLVHKTNPHSTDSDFDGLNDNSELNIIQTNPNIYDTDKDGLGDGDEVQRGTSPNDPDSDNDTIKDGEEVALDINPLSSDTDGDTLKDNDEINVWHTNPKVADTDGDGVDDNDEIANGTPASSWQRYQDTDQDHLTDYQEMLRGTQVNNKDTDGDGLWDGFEVKIGLNPKNTNTNGTGRDDWWEYRYSGGLQNGGHIRARTPAKKHTSKTLPTLTGPNNGVTPKYDTRLGTPFPKGLLSIDEKFVNQGKLGDCWILADILATIAHNPAYIHDLIKDNQDGTYTVKLYKNTQRQPVFITVDNQFTSTYANLKSQTITVEENFKMVSVDVKVLWPVILEKAAAQYKGSYGALIGKSVGGHMELIHGMGSSWSWGVGSWLDWIKVIATIGIGYQGNRKNIFQKALNNSKRLDLPLILSTSKVAIHDRLNGPCQGIPNHHAVAYMKQTRTSAAGKTEYLLRDPHSKMAQNGNKNLHWFDIDRLDSCFWGHNLSSRRMSVTYMDR